MIFISCLQRLSLLESITLDFSSCQDISNEDLSYLREKLHMLRFLRFIALGSEGQTWFRHGFPKYSLEERFKVYYK